MVAVPHRTRRSISPAAGLLRCQTERAAVSAPKLNWMALQLQSRHQRASIAQWQATQSRPFLEYHPEVTSFTVAMAFVWLNYLLDDIGGGCFQMLPNDAERRVQLVHIAQGIENEVILCPPLASVQRRGALVPSLRVNLDAAHHIRTIKSRHACTSRMKWFNKRMRHRHLVTLGRLDRLALLHISEAGQALHRLRLSSLSMAADWPSLGHGGCSDDMLSATKSSAVVRCAPPVKRRVQAVSWNSLNARANLKTCALAIKHCWAGGGAPCCPMLRKNLKSENRIVERWNSNTI